MMGSVQVSADSLRSHPMPSRAITALIVAFWLATIGWFVSREVLPKWWAGEPPTYTIELADEANRHPIPNYWTLSYNGKNVGRLRTSLRYVEASDTFELSASSAELAFMENLNLFGVRFSIVIRDYDDRIRVSREGELRAMSTAAKLAVQSPAAHWEAPFQVKAWIEDGVLRRNGQLQIPGQKLLKIALEAGETPRGRILNPMHPVQRIVGLKPGQQWQQNVVDPRGEIIRAVVKQELHIDLPAPPSAMTAKVLSEVRPLKFNGELQSCWIIEYRGDDSVARTWVRQSDGTVLRQEAEAHGETLVLQRE